MKFCPECGNPVEGYKFCPNCGYSIANQEPTEQPQPVFSISCSTKQKNGQSRTT